MSWLRHYGNAEAYRWRKDGQVFTRPLGFVETSFDTDGRYFEGRADMNCLVTLAVHSTLSRDEFRERVLLAWTGLCCRHLLLQARAVNDDDTAAGLHFAVDIHHTVSKAVEAAGQQCVFLDDHFDHVDHRDFYTHCQNASRVVDPEIALAKLFVLPLATEDGELVLRLQLVLAHQIADGISINAWMKSFVALLNDPIDLLKAQIRESIDPGQMERRLPLPQEALYPPIPGSIARQRWYWAIVRILRHVRRPLPPGFANPLRRREIQAPVPLSPVYEAVLNYKSLPPLNTIPVDIRVSPVHTSRLHRLTREARASVGAGIYAMVAICMMELYEKRSPQVQLQDRKTFISGFPLNPRAFFGFNTDPDSMMLAFSDGIALPFLSSHLDLAGRLRLLARQAQRQLSAYQKRAKAGGDDATRQFWTSRGAGLVLANQYLYGIERAEMLLPPHKRKSTTTTTTTNNNNNNNNIQGNYPARPNATPQTCGVSSVGNRDLQLRSGTFDVHQQQQQQAGGEGIEGGFVADFRDLTASVRAREGELLVGISGTRGGLVSLPSVDMSAMDPVLVEAFRDRFESMLGEIEMDEGERARM